jgi:phosphatidate cytidylyltransferase
MAQPTDRPPSDRLGGLTNLQKRTLSAAVLLPLVIAAVFLGHSYFNLLVAAFAGVIAWEWTRVAANTKNSAQTAPIPNAPVKEWGTLAAVSAFFVVGAVASAGHDPAGSQWMFVLGVGVILVAAGSLVGNRARSGWFVLGLLYAAIPAIGLVIIRAEPTFGRANLFWIIALVVAADTGGYLVGRTVGGPKLAPRISPNKTWSGLGGAVAGAALVGLLTAFMLNHTYVWTLTLVSAGLGLVEQAGDLVESAFKRHFGVKDTSQVIPGHGGVLDRVDGLLAVAVAVVIANEWAGGSVLAW